MICYLDKTFCTAVNCSNRKTCSRNLTKYHENRAYDLGLPIAFADFSKESCFIFKESINDLHNTN